MSNINKLVYENLILSDISPDIYSHTNRNKIIIGQNVAVVEKNNQKNGKLTIGKVKRILTNSNLHHRGIKVMLDNNIVGRVQKIL